MKRILLTFLCLSAILCSFAQKGMLVPEWVKKDSVNYMNILRLISNKDLLSHKDKFLKSIVPFDLRGQKDLGFGLSYLYGGQYGGYVTAWVSFLCFKNEVIQYTVHYPESDYEIIELILNRNPELKSKVAVAMEKCEPHSFCFTNVAALDAFKENVAASLGKMDLSADTSKVSRDNFDFLTNPIRNYHYGTRCGEGGSTLEGRLAINYFTDRNDVKAIRGIMKGYNPEGRLYAIDALLTLSADKKITLTKEDEALIKKIIELDIPISSCSGCMVTNFRTAGEVLRSPRYKNREKAVIELENKIRKEQNIPLRKK